MDEHALLTHRILEGALTVHTELGPGFVEKVYEAALVLELQHLGLTVAQQVRVPLFYRDVPIGEHWLDLLVEDEVVVELKAVHRLAFAHIMTVKSYLRATGKRVALLLNFTACPLEIKRVFPHRASR